MKLHYNIAVPACLLLLSHACLAQNGQKIIPVILPSENSPSDNCRQCDSLSEVYLEQGDTSMALYYLDKFLEANPHEAQTKTAMERFRKLYSQHSSSFYLKEY